MQLVIDAMDALMAEDMNLLILGNGERGYEDFFRALKPCSFRMRDGRSGRLHTGYIAQEVEEALGEAGLTNGDFAGLVINPETDAFEYGLRYADFSALHTYMIQRLEERVRALERSRT